MKANELRIGNLIVESLPFGSDKIIKVDSNIFNRRIDEFIPIPLTEERLLEFEQFYKDEEYWVIGRFECKYCFKYRDWANNWAFYIEYTDSGNPNDDGVKYPIAFDIKYVHQLQNLYFALTGEELILK